MLLPSDLQYNLQNLRFFSFFGILPLNFDQNGVGKVSLKTSFGAKFLFKFWQLFSLAHILFVSFRAVDYFSEENSKVHHLPVVIITWGNVISVAAIAWIAFDVKGDLAVKSFKEIFVVLQENYSKIQKYKGVKKSMGRKIRMKTKIQNQIEMMKGKNIYELITMYTPFIINQCILIIPALYFLDPEIPVFLISNFSRETRTWWVFGMCLCLEITVYLFYWGVVNFEVCVIQSFIHSTRHSIQWQIKMLSDEGHSLTMRLLDVETSIKAIELRVNLFNLAYSNIMYIEKLISMDFGVGLGFGALLLIHTEPIFTALYGGMFVVAISIFIVIFNRAFDIETASRQLRLGIFVQSQRFRLNWKREECKRKILAIRPMGIKLGGFSKVEREAVPIFTNFVIHQIIGLLLM